MRSASARQMRRAGHFWPQLQCADPEIDPSVFRLSEYTVNLSQEISWLSQPSSTIFNRAPSALALCRRGHLALSPT